MEPVVAETIWYSEAMWGFIGVVVGALITIASDFAKSSFQSRKAASYLAIRVVCILDQYVDGCIAIVFDEGDVLEDDWTISYSRYPELTEYPTDVDWKVLESKLMYRILNLPNIIRDARRYLSEVGQHATPPYDDMAEPRQYEFAKLGLLTLELAEAIRDKYNLPAHTNPRDAEWNSGIFFQKKIADVEALKRERQEEHKEFLHDQNAFHELEEQGLS